MLIEKEELLDIILGNEQFTKWQKEEIMECINCCIMYNKVKQPQWIPCSDKLPSEEGEYIVSCINDNGYEFVSDDYFYPSESNVEGGFFDAFGADVVAWQPLPQTYEEEEETK